MTRDTLEGGRHTSTVLVLVLLLLSSMPLLPSAAADIGIPSELQAQDISATFDDLSETTTITWRNIDQTGGDLDLYEDLWDTTYRVYRHTAQITPANIGNLTEWASVIACNKDVLGESTLRCRGGGSNPHPGHSVTYQVGAGTNGTYFYAVVTYLEDGSISAPLDFNASSTLEPVYEFTTPIRSPYNVDASFDPSLSQTTVTWINYNSINPVLPESGDDAIQIHLWRTDYPITRSNGQGLLAQSTPIQTLAPTTTKVVLDIDFNTNREVYYSVTYLLPNYTHMGEDYEDARFLSNNAMTESILEDNVPPSAVGGVSADFAEDILTGSGNTTISWNDVPGETDETYRIYVSGVLFNNTLDPNAQLLATVSENISQFVYQVPTGTLGTGYYCVAVVDQFGAYSSDIQPSACAFEFEDAFNNWVAEPTNVYAQFLGDGITRVTWADQLGVEGEMYNIWRSNYRVGGFEFVENESLTWVGSVPDGVQSFDINLNDLDLSGDGILESSFYFVTTEARYGHVNGTYHFTGLVNNFFGPVSEDTRAPLAPTISTVTMVGGLEKVVLVWVNSGSESGEVYDIYRHFGDPFGDANFTSSNATEAEGWVHVMSVQETDLDPSTIVREIPVPSDSEQNVWYAVVIADSHGNSNPSVYEGLNAAIIYEDTKAPTIAFDIKNSEGISVDSTALTKGEYSIRITSSENLFSDAIINISTSAGASLTQGAEQLMTKTSDNLHDPTKGPDYYYPIELKSSTKAGDIKITINLTDMSGNLASIIIDNYRIDASAPTITIFSPSDEGDGSKYLYGNKIKIVAGAEDDIGIASMQIRFIRNFGEANMVSEPWRNVSGLTIAENGDWTIAMEYNSGNFLSGVHEVQVKATDSAGNERSSKVRFVVDNCQHRSDGKTICEYSEPVQDDAEQLVAVYNLTDPPFMVAWVTAGMAFLAIIVSLMVIGTAMSGPKKKKSGDDDDEDEDWMKEFVGTSQDPDMDAITGGEKEEEPKEESKAMAVESEEDDPFAVNTLTQKRRRKKSSDDDDDDDEKPKKRKSGKRRSIKRKK
jgi:hypothetical protein